ncbi:uncharacterized protein LOC119746414 [Patiria miniata]|uniref:Uncharacterized protein n=1 Tax=Patiria miniata TaxID=46514 RepID=A0A914BSV2_PATMI|nr:uncharacterized protein LOC119746414 [Patiria miniata]XP_038079265.1 uncharacterized protein LOC119746414 [Patiria miniata]
MADEAILHINPSEDEGLMGQLDDELSFLTQLPIAETACSSLSKPTPPAPAAKAKKRTAKRKNIDQANSCTLNEPPSAAKTSSDNSDLHKAVSSLQQTVATLTNAFLHRSDSGSSHYANRFPTEEILSEGEIPDDNLVALNLAPETGNDNAIVGNSYVHVPEKGIDTFTEGDLDNLLCDTGNQDDLLTEMAALIESDEKESSALNDQLAKTVNALAQGKIKPEKLEEKLGKYNKPSNCGNLCLTRVNPEIWSILKPTTRARDVKFQKVQSSFVRASIAIAMATDQMLKARNNNETIDTAQLIRMLVDAIAILGSGNAQLNLRRRDSIRPDLNQKYAALCSSQVPCTSLLFGDDLVQSCKTIVETNKISSQMFVNDPKRRNTRQFSGRGSSHRAGHLITREAEATIVEHRVRARVITVPAAAAVMAVAITTKPQANPPAPGPRQPRKR